MEKLKKQLEDRLNRYSGMRKELEMLQYELKCLTAPLCAEDIESRVLSQPDFERVSGSRISDKTADIVVEYVSGQQDARYHVLTAMIRQLKTELQRLKYYVSLLPAKEEEIIRFFYFDNLPWSEITGRLPVTQRTLESRKKSGLDKLLRYYALTDGLGLNLTEPQIQPRFVSYLHEERFTDCMQRIGNDICPGTSAMLYIISGCNELWNMGVDSFFDFVLKKPLKCEESALSANSANLLKFAHYLESNADIGKSDNLYRYIPVIDYVHLEIAIEAIKLVLSSFST